MSGKKKVLAILLILAYVALASKGEKLVKKDDMTKVSNTSQGVASSQESSSEEGDSLGDIQYLLDNKYECLTSESKVCKSQDEFTNELKNELMNKSVKIGLYYAGEENLKPFLGIEANTYNIEQAKCSYVYENGKMGVIFDVVYEIVE